MSVQNLQIAGYVSTGNFSKFLCIEGSTAWLFDCPRFFSPLIEADKSFDSLPIYHQDTVVYIDPIPRQSIKYTTLVSCADNLPGMSLH